jgi:cell division protein YceG involved in septum cleavage
MPVTVPVRTSNNKLTIYVRRTIWLLIVFLTIAALLLISVLQTKRVAMSTAIDATTTVGETPELPPFPIGVDPIAQVIEENPEVEAYVHEFVASNHTAPSFEDSWLDRAMNRLATLDWYQSLATPATRILVIQSGERHEEIARNFARILRWSDAEKTVFTDRLMDEVPAVKDGKLYPGRYIVSHDAGPEEVAIAVADRFNAEVRTRYTDEVAEKLPLKDALIIASLIEREAYDFTDMRYISGVIWNRLFIDMKLQIDATLQYARGAQSAAAGGRWWPVPRPEDKFIKSPFNTYQNTGLPPAPIANPSIDAIVAALNPRETDCLFYYHTNDGTFYCNATYEEHVAGIRKHLK